MTTYATYADKGLTHPGFPAAHRSPGCSCGSTQRCDAALGAILMPEEDSRLHARAQVDFGQVSVGPQLSASIGGTFNIRIHVPRALQQQIAGNTLVGSVLGNARISADISERVGIAAPQCAGDTDVCLFVDFHEQRRGYWMVDLRALRGSRLRVPLYLEALALKHTKVVSASVLPIALEFHEDVMASLGPIIVQSRSVADLWRSIREPAREWLTARIAGIADSELSRMRAALRASRRTESDEGGLELLSRAVCALL